MIWRADPEVLRLFPTFVWKAQLAPEIHAAIDAAIWQTLQDSAPRELGSGDAWQSGYGLHQLDAFREFLSAVDAAVGAVLEFLRIGHHAFRITGCWANVNAPGGTHRLHSHPNNFLSGVYYLQVQAGADTINFHDPRAQTAIIRPPVTTLTAYTTDQVVVRVVPGVLLLFPAWLQHSVDPNTSAENRISVSFNVMFEEFAEVLAEPLWGER